jgi:hypothetical protein
MQAHAGHIAEKLEESETGDKGAIVDRSEVATTPFAATIIGVTRSQWMRPALMTLALVVALLGVTGCPSHH